MINSIIAELLIPNAKKVIKIWNHEKIFEAWNHTLIIELARTGNFKESKSLRGITLLSIIV